MKSERSVYIDQSPIGLPYDGWTLLLQNQGIYYSNDGGTISVAQVKIDDAGEAHLSAYVTDVRNETQYIIVEGSLVEIAPSSVDASKLIYWN